MKIKLFVFSLIPVISIFGCSPERTETEIEQPNILFVISDDQSFAHTSFAGSTFVQTPAFDRVAREGVYFTNCIAGSPGCAPSRSAIVTGRYHWQNEQSGQHGAPWLKKYVPFVDMLDSNGYITGRTGKGVSPFQYARNEGDSLWRETDAGGIAHSNIGYKSGTSEDVRPADEISSLDYFENFKYFMENVRGNKPFFFWFGSSEPHRGFEQDSWKRTDKKLSDVQVPEFLPDNDIVRGDLLDYAVEIEWFDLHLGYMLDYLEEIGELDNTIVVVTSDNGMAFPGAKALSYEYGIHVPFAVRFPKSFPGGRTVDDVISFSDLAPTILDLSNTSNDGMMPMSGRSIRHILESEAEGIVDPAKEHVFAGRERHSASRYQNMGYPQRAVRSRDHLLVWNLTPERWPAGAPQRLKPETEDELLPLYGIDDNGVHHSDWAFTDVDASPTKSYIAENWQDEHVKPYFDGVFGKAPEFLLFDVANDPYCLNNLAEHPDFISLKEEMKEVLEKELKASGDPRLVGPDTGVFDTYLRYMPMREFPKPDDLKSQK